MIQFWMKVMHQKFPELCWFLVMDDICKHVHFYTSDAGSVHIHGQSSWVLLCSTLSQFMKYIYCLVHSYHDHPLFPSIYMANSSKWRFPFLRNKRQNTLVSIIKPGSNAVPNICLINFSIQYFVCTLSRKAWFKKSS